MRVAVVGAGISGLAAAWLLARRYEVTLFEREPRLGGHAHTHVIRHAGRTWTLDSGFLVFNERTYPHFVRLLREVGVAAQPSDMSFGVRCRRCGLAYASRDAASFFAQRRRLADPRHWRLLTDIRRFHADARTWLTTADTAADADVSLGAFVAARNYGDGFVRHFLLPMTGAIWSASFDDMRAFPARTILRFLENHGLLAISGAPSWFTVSGGSARYVDALAATLEASRVRRGEAVRSIARETDGVFVTSADGVDRFDACVLATHADEALALLSDPSDAERDALGAFRFSRNPATLHADRAALPARRAAWASWNLDLADCRDERAPVAITYHLNRLQGLSDDPPLFASLNRAAGDAEPFASMVYTHPILDRAAVAAQPRVQALMGVRRTYYCGAWLRYGFHEDGLMSAIDAAGALGVTW